MFTPTVTPNGRWVLLDRLFNLKIWNIWNPMTILVQVSCWGQPVDPAVDPEITPRGGGRPLSLGFLVPRRRSSSTPGQHHGSAAGAAPP